MATHSSILVWRIPWTEEPNSLQSIGSQKVGHYYGSNTFTFTFFTRLQKLRLNCGDRHDIGYKMIWQVPGTKEMALKVYEQIRE